MHAVIVGGGVLGTMHAHQALARGWSVTHLERDLEARSATVRNFGMVWISGRAPGDELAHALRSRALWEHVGAHVPEVGFDPQGSLLIVWEPDELAVLHEVMARPDAGQRGLGVVDQAEARRLNPTVRGELLAALHCSRDAKVEPASCLPGVRSWLTATNGDRYHYEAGCTVTAIGDGFVVDSSGTRHDGDLVIVCPGATNDGPIAELIAGRPVRRVRLQMLSTEAPQAPLRTMLADSDSLRYYPAFAGPARDRLAPPAPVVTEHHMQMLCSQRTDGSLTLGDTHEYHEPFAVGVLDEPERHLLGQLGRILGTDPPPVLRRWAGVYSQSTDPERIWHCEFVTGRTVVVTGPGGRGMTLAPAIAEQTFLTHDPSANPLEIP